MVNYSEGRTEHIFNALADRTRRDMLQRLAHHSLTVSELAKPYRMSLPAVSKHVRILEGAGLVQRQISGRIHTIHLNPEPLRVVLEYVQVYERFWTTKLDALQSYMEKGGGSDE